MPILDGKIVGQLLVFSGIGFSILMAVVTYMSSGTVNIDEPSRSPWYFPVTGSLIFVIPFYLFGTLATVIYIGFQWSSMLITAYWAILIGTLLAITFFAYFLLRGLFDMGWDYWRVRGINKDNQID